MDPTSGTAANGVQDAYQDGNVLAGPLSEIFAVDLTAAMSRCARCDSTGAVATLRVYGRPPALVARCPSCGEVVLRIVRSPGNTWLDLRGTVTLNIPMDTP
ncbi:DUF6510 family protein [Streptomyces cocklensis]|jgi:hypothetical protein|uniref:Uncharacterized protein n=1 Tax=Actinacidiphila cocklensis TaxID=887465 RepID=A0A9W4GUG1_9ACTN|nr:DUF6510 family protein [Actinacidiphila cocklensis]MDD1063500.1 DUF6510 family protein [Actinacidiphila cocklensis]WSX75639.1 DUF6510 family protein [Streptomyces sp. NBC_00899]CAG6398099.1 conserved hypothetical protein [Actinacidiphila cocklensis]